MHRRIVHMGMGITATVLPLLWLGGRLPAAEQNADLTRQIMALNDVTGTDTIEGTIKTLTDDPEKGKKLVTACVPLVGDKKLRFNGAYILARVAQELKDLESGRALYRACIAQAKQLQSEHQL